MATRYRKLGVLIGCAMLAVLIVSSAGVSQAFVTLTVTKTGTGSGTVTSSPPGINCGTTCSASFQRNTTVVLTATPNAGSVVQSWSGCDSPSGNQCTVTMTSNRTVTVNFSTTSTFTLTVTVSGNGSVSSSPSGINSCRSSCSASFTANKVVTLTATPDSGWSFTGWSGACSGAGTCQITMDANKSVAATFSQRPVLTVTKTGTGTGTVTSSPAGINCDPDCTESYDLNTEVRLTATPSADSTVSSWSGCDSVSQDRNTCTLRMTGNRTVTVTFTRALPVCNGYTSDTEGTVNPDLCQPLDQQIIGVTIRGDGNGSFADGPNACPIESGCGNDRVFGTAGDDVIYGDDSRGGVERTGHDRIMGNGGNDTIYGEAGNDFIVGGDMNDFIDGGLGNDVIDGRYGVDTLNGGGGNDTFIIRAGNPSVGEGTTTVMCTQNPGESGRVLVRGNFKARIPFGTYRSRETMVVIEDRSVSFSSPMIYEIMTGPGKCVIRRG